MPTSAVKHVSRNDSIRVPSLNRDDVALIASTADDLGPAARNYLYAPEDYDDQSLFLIAWLVGAIYAIVICAAVALVWWFS